MIVMALRGLHSCFLRDSL